MDSWLTSAFDKNPPPPLGWRHLWTIPKLTDTNMPLGRQYNTSLYMFKEGVCNTSISIHLVYLIDQSAPPEYHSYKWSNYYPYYVIFSFQITLLIPPPPTHTHKITCLTSNLSTVTIATGPKPSLYCLSSWAVLIYVWFSKHLLRQFQSFLRPPHN